MPYTDKQKQLEAARLAISKAAWELNEEDAIRTGEFLQVIEANVGNAGSPVEDFIVGLPSKWIYGIETGYPLTPDSIIEEINAPHDGMREWFDDAVEITKRFNSRYRRVIEASTAQANAEGGEAESDSATAD